MEPKKPTAYVYVDALNFYYGALRRGPHKWLNLEKFFDGLLPEYTVKKIYFFSAFLKPKFNPTDLGVVSRQKAYFAALKTLPRVEMVMGSFSYLHDRLRLRISGQNSFANSLKAKLGNTRVAVWRIEEKGADVSLGSFLTRDALLQRAELLLVVTNDSDLVGTLHMLRTEFDAPVGLCFPNQHGSKPLSGTNPLVTVKYSQELLEASQFPFEIEVAKGTVSRPDSW